MTPTWYYSRESAAVTKFIHGLCALNVTRMGVARDGRTAQVVQGYQKSLTGTVRFPFRLTSRVAPL